MVNGRPRKTQEELDKEMEDYWGSREEAPAAENGAGNGVLRNGNGGVGESVEVVMDDGDIDMIE